MTNLPNEEWLRQQTIQARCFHPYGTWEEFPKATLGESIISRFEAIVARYPARLAVKSGDEQYTYAELNRAANRLAHAILAVLGEGAEPIVFLLEQGAAAMITLLAVLKSGKFYVALEPTHPLVRSQALLADTESRLLITDQKELAMAQQSATAGQAILNIDQLAPSLPTTNPSVPIADDAIAYLVYTSGTTGTPKGVIETHRNVLHFSRVAINSYHLCPEDRVGSTSSNSFSGTAGKMYPALLSGASLFPLAMKQQDFRMMSCWLRSEGITYFITVPTQFRQWMQTLEGTEQFPQLRFLGLGGDRLQADDITLYRKYLKPDCLFRISFGLSEKKYVTHYMMDKSSLLPAIGIPVGYCVEETSVLLLDEEGEPVPPGEIGEIVVRSPYLSPGYWRKPEQTAARFRLDPHDPSQRLYYTGDLGMLDTEGCLFHKGRKDFQIKIRGVRIEAAEVEEALWRCGEFKELVVTARPDAQGEAQLVAYLVPKGMPPTISNLRRQLTELLPAQLVPTRYVFLDALPLNANRKIDLRALPNPTATRPQLDVRYEPPSHDLEQWLVACWEEVIAIHPIGIADHFLDLGGDSLKAMRIASRIKSHFGDPINVMALLQCATIKEQAGCLLDHLLQQVERLSESETTALLADAKKSEAVSDEKLSVRRR